MINATKNLYNDYEKLLIRNEYLEKTNKEILYKNNLLKSQVMTLESTNQGKDKKIKEYEEVIVSKERENQKLKALLEIDGTNAGIPTFQTPISKKEVIPNSREKSGNK